jgi:RluA family pseudouridine synthase
VRHLTQRVEAGDSGRRLDELVGEWLSEALGTPLSKSAVRRLIMAGVVRVGGRPQRRPAEPLRAGDRLEARIDPERLLGARDAPFALRRDRILYEDEWLLAIDKPPGLSTVATADPARPHLVAAVEQYLRAQGAAAAYVGVHQRLDRDTSGVVLFAKDRSVNAALAHSFAEHEAEKTYDALVVRTRRTPPATWQCADPVDGQAAETAFTRREVLARGVRVEARPRTGRKHQIRIHLAAAGWPILGDARYGAAGGGAERPSVPRLMLHARALRIPHPKTGRVLSVECELPDDFERARAELGAVRTGGGAPR